MTLFKKPVLTKIAPKPPKIPKPAVKHPRVPTSSSSTGIGIAGGLGLSAIPLLSTVLPSLTTLGSSAILASTIPDTVTAIADVFDGNPILSMGIAGAVMLAAYKLF